MLQKIHNLKKHHQFLYSVIIAIGLIAVWRGIWGILDLYLFQNNPLISFSASIVFGLIILGITHQKLS